MIRSSSGQILVPNAGAWTGVYFASGTLPEAAEVNWTTPASFVAPLPTKNGETVTISHGITDPAGATITAEIGTGTTEGAFTAHLDLGEGLTGVVPTSLVGSVMTMRLQATYTSSAGLVYTTATAFVSSGVVIQTDVVNDAFPADIAPGDWTSSEVRTGSVSGKRTTTLSGGVTVPSGFELRWYSGTVSGGVGNDGVTTKIDPGQTFTTNGQLLIGQTCYNVYFWKRLSDGVYQRAHPLAEQKVFTILGLIIVTPPGTFPPADQVLASASTSAIVAALNARISSGSTADWIIELPSGSYGHLSLANMNLPGRTFLRSQDRSGLGARFTSSQINTSSNIYFQCIDINRSGLGFGQNIFEWYSVHNMGLSYSRIYCPEITRDSLGIGYIERGRYGIRVDHDGSSGYSSDILIHENLISGPMGEPIYLNGLNRATVSNNVAENVCGDMMMFGHVTDVDVLNNWGSRLHYPSWDPNARNGAGDFYHSDMCQVFSLAPSRRVRYIGNVFIAAKHPTLPGITRQGILVQGQTGSFLFSKNIIVTNCFQGHWVERSNEGGHAFENVTLLRIIDLPSTQNSTYFRLEGSTNPATWVLNIQQHTSGWGGVRNIPVSGTNFTASLSYYTNPRAEIAPGVLSSFYDCRPVAGTLAHWGYTGGPAEGAAERFREVIVDGSYPKIGPAAVAWKAWYDPRGQIAA